MGDARPIAAVRVTEDSPIARGPVLFWGYAATPTAAWSFSLRDGVNTSAPIRIQFGDSAGVGVSLSLTRPVLFDRGIFADLGAGLTSVTIFFEPVREEAIAALGADLSEGDGPDD